MDHTTGKKLDPTVPQSVPVLTRKLEEAVAPVKTGKFAFSIPKQPPTHNNAPKQSPARAEAGGVPSPYLKASAKPTIVDEEEVIDDEVVHEE
jgi:hypothetical protein